MAVMIDQLETYLRDHRAGAEFGSNLARRLYEQNVDTPYEEPLRTIADQIGQDVATLEGIMDRLDIGKSTMKTALGSVGEKLGRLKPNNALTAYSPLSRVLEMEQLRGGIEGKHALWDALSEAAPHDERLDSREIAVLLERADAQLSTLRELHKTAAREAFAPI